MVNLPVRKGGYSHLAWLRGLVGLLLAGGVFLSAEGGSAASGNTPLRFNLAKSQPSFTGATNGLPAAACLTKGVVDNDSGYLTFVFATNITQLGCESLENPLGIDLGQPRLSWVMESARRDERQTAHQILVASSADLLRQNQGDCWDSGKVASDQSIQVGGSLPDPEKPGFKRIIKPAIVGDLTWVKTHCDSIHGRISSNWRREGGRFTIEIPIPANTTATVYVPTKDAAGVTESGKPVAEAEGVTFQRMQDAAAVYAVGSGAYHFQSTLSATVL